MNTTTYMVYKMFIISSKLDIKNILYKIKITIIVISHLYRNYLDSMNPENNDG